MTKKYEPVDRKIIDNLETLKVLSDPLRVRLLDLMGRPTTVKAMAEQLGTTTNKLYYHINMMEKHDLITVVDTNIVSGIIEKSYQATARSYYPARDLFMDETSPAGYVKDMLTSIFDATIEEVVAGIESGTIAHGEAELEHDPTSDDRNISMSKVSGWITQARFKELIQQMTALLEEFTQQDNVEPEDENAVHMGFTYVLYEIDKKTVVPGDDEERFDE